MESASATFGLLFSTPSLDLPLCSLFSNRSGRGMRTRRPPSSFFLLPLLVPSLFPGFSFFPSGLVRNETGTKTILFLFPLFLRFFFLFFFCVIRTTYRTRKKRNTVTCCLAAGPVFSFPPSLPFLLFVVFFSSEFSLFFFFSFFFVGRFQVVGY